MDDEYKKIKALKKYVYELDARESRNEWWINELDNYYKICDEFKNEGYRNVILLYGITY